MHSPLSEHPVRHTPVIPGAAQPVSVRIQRAASGELLVDLPVQTGSGDWSHRTYVCASLAEVAQRLAQHGWEARAELAQE